MEATRAGFVAPVCVFLATAAVPAGLRDAVFEREAVLAELAFFVVSTLATCLAGSGGAGTISRLPGSASAAADEFAAAISVRVVR